MNRRLIVETAFNMARVLSGKFGNGLGEEELRQMFEECFKTCKAGLEAYCLEDQRIQQNIRPLEERHHVRSKAV